MGFEHGVHGESMDQDAGAHPDPDLGVISLQRVCFVAGSETITDPRKFVDNEVGDGWCAVVTPLAWEEQIEPIEELLGETDDPVRHAGGVFRPVVEPFQTRGP